MIIKISDKQFLNIAKDVTDKFIKDYFDKNNREFIYGDEIIDFAPHKQVNLFVLFQIFSDWNNFVNSLQHPYFDFENPEVQEAVTNLKNVLSRHIRINKEHMTKMTEKAVINNIRLLLDPVNTFVTFFFPSRSVISLNSLEKYSPYFEDFGFVVQSITTFMKKNNIDKIKKQEYITNAHKIIKLYEKKSGKSIKSYQNEKFKELTGKSLEELLAKSPSISVKKIQQHGDKTSEEILKKLLGTEVNSDEIETSGDKKLTNPLLSAVHYVGKPKVGETFTPSEGINDKFSKIKIKEIPLHKQFNFVQNLFNGDNVLFQRTIDKINTLSSYEEALAYLRENVFSKTMPKSDDPVLTDFLGIIKKNFEK